MHLELMATSQHIHPPSFIATKPTLAFPKIDKKDSKSKAKMDNSPLNNIQGSPTTRKEGTHNGKMFGSNLHSKHKQHSIFKIEDEKRQRVQLYI